MVLPIGDEQATGRRTAYATWALAAALLLVYAYQARLTERANAELVAGFGLVPSRLFGDPGQAWPILLTHVFLHGGSLHVVGNVLFLVVFGRRVESELRPAGFLAFFVAGGVVAGLASAVSRWGSSTPGIGASGAISAVMGAYLVLFAATRIRILVVIALPVVLFGRDLPAFDVPALYVILFWFAMQVGEGLGSLASSGGVDYAAHVGGLLAGYLAIRALRGAFGLWPDEATGPAAVSEEIPLESEDACLGAARPLEAGRRLASADLQVQRRRPADLDAEAIPAAMLGKVVGRRLLTPRFRYDAIRWRDLEPTAEAAGDGSTPPAPTDRAEPN